MSTFSIAEHKNLSTNGDQLLDLLKTALEVDTIDRTASVGNVEKWDSIGHLTVIAAIEQIFDVTISFSDAVNLTSYQKILLYLKKKDALK